MTTADRWTRVVRERVGLGRLLPLGGPVDGAWIAERAARHVLLAAAGNVPGVRPGGLRVGPVDPDAGREPAVPPPPGALPPGELRVTADFAAFAGGAAPEPLPATAARLRAALTEAATARLGLAVVDVDLRVTDLLGPDAATGTAVGREPDAGPGPADAPDEGATGSAGDTDGDGGADGGDEGRVAAAALAVPGVVRLTGVLGRSVHVTRSPRDDALPRRHVRVELALDAERRADEVARRVRAAVSEVLPDRPSVAVVVTAVG
ncbi:nucleopolyhedrovirus P10 family protein [Streptomyces sp. NPDC003730]